MKRSDQLSPETLLPFMHDPLRESTEDLIHRSILFVRLGLPLSSCSRGIRIVQPIRHFEAFEKLFGLGFGDEVLGRARQV